VKKLFLTMTAALALAATPALADVGTEATVGVNFDIFGVFLDVFSGSAEVKMPIPKVTAKVDVTWSPNYFWVTNVSGLDLAATGRYYFGSLLSFDLSPEFQFLKRGPLEGLYAGGGVSFHTWSWSYGGYSWSYFAPGVVLEAGAKYFPQNQWSWWPNNFYVEGGLVVGLNLPAEWKDSDGNKFTGSEPNVPGGADFNVNVGYAF